MSSNQENRYKVFVSIVSYNGEDLIEKCLSSIIKSSIPLEVFVVDNNSQDKTREIVENKFPQVELIKSKVNLGFGKANNIVLKRFLADKADFIFLLNQDATVEVNTIEELVCTMNDLSDAGIVSPLHKESILKLDANFSNYLKRPKSFDILSEAMYSEIQTNYEVDFVNAAAWLLSRRTIKKVGGFNPLFFMYGEDENYCQRVLRNNLKILINTKCHIIHSRLFSEITNNDKFSSRRFSMKKERMKQLLLAMNPNQSLYRNLINDYSIRIARIFINISVNKGKGALTDLMILISTAKKIFKYKHYRRRQVKGFLDEK